MYFVFIFIGMSGENYNVNILALMNTCTCVLHYFFTCNINEGVCQCERFSTLSLCITY